MAPEIIGRLFSKESKHGLAVDWWAVGILTYEMIVGHTPFYSKNHHETWRLIRNKEARYPGLNHPEIQMSAECRDFIKKCLHKDPKQRLGSINDAEEVLSHPWFQTINVTDLLQKNIKPPFIPSNKNSDDTSNFDKSTINSEV